MSRRANFLAVALMGLIVSTGDADEQLWQPRRIHKFGHDAACDLSFSPDGHQLVTGDPAAIRSVVWDIGPTLRTRSAIFSPDRRFNPLGFTPDGTRLVCYSNSAQKLFIHDAITNESHLLGDAQTPARISPNGLWLVATAPMKSASNSIHVYDLAKEKLLSTFSVHEPNFISGGILDIRFGHHGNSTLVLFNGSPQRIARLWDLPTGSSQPVLLPAPTPFRLWMSPEGAISPLETTSPLTTDRHLRSVDFTTDGKTIALLTDKSITVREYLGQRILGTCSVDSQFSSGVVKLSRDGKRVAATDLQGPVVLDLETQVVSRIRRRPGEVRCVAFSHDGRLLAAARENFLEVWNPHSDQDPLLLEDRMPLIETLGFHPSVPVLAAGSISGSVHLWDVTAKTQRVFIGHSRSVTSLAFHPQGRQLVTGSIDANIKVWNIEDGRELKSLTVGGPVRSVALRSDGILAVGTKMPSIELWNVDSGDRMGILDGHASGVMSVAFSADGRSLVSTSTDKTLRVWNIEDRTCVQTILDVQADVVAASFVGSRVVSVDSEGKASLWKSDAVSRARTATYLRRRRPWEPGVLATSPDGRTVASAFSNEAVAIFDADLTQ